MLAEALPRFLPKGVRKPAKLVDFDNLNLSADDLAAKLASYDVVIEAHNNVIAMTKKHSSDMLVRNLIEAILDSKALRAYKIPLCFREVDDDLTVYHDEVEIPLD